jgi:hypothetical protein
MKPINRDELAQLVQDARIKPRLARELRFVPEEIHDWQDRDYIAVMNRSRNAGVLIYPERRQVTPFTLQRRKPNTAGRIAPIICDICATWRRGSESSVITFPKGRSSVSFLCCEDLLCSLHVRDRTEAAVLSRTQLRENITTEARIERLTRRLRSLLNGAG